MVFSTPLVNCCPSTFSLTSPTPPTPLPKVNVQYKQTVCGCVGGGGGGVLSCVVDHILQEFNTLFLTRLRTYNIATPPQTKTPVKTPYRDWCLFSSFVHGSMKREGGFYREGETRSVCERHQRHNLYFPAMRYTFFKVSLYRRGNI